MSSHPDSVNGFLDYLDEKLIQAGDPHDREATKEMLAAADELWTDSGLENFVTGNEFPSRISGNSYIEEQFNEELQQRAVVDLVQQGGTMLGIGLVGYTYIMEKARVRFRSMAGTSAGAINTLFIASLPDKIYHEPSPFDSKRQATKSEFLAHVVANKKFNVFLDRGGVLGKIQQWAIGHINQLYKLKTWFIILFLALFFFLSVGLYLMITGTFFTNEAGLSNFEINLYKFLTGTFSVVAFLTLILLLVFSLFRKTMGFNPGKKIYDWFREILESPYVAVRTTKELNDAMENKPLLKHQKIAGQPLSSPTPEKPADYNDQKRLVFITANLTDGRITKFPENAKDYWNKQFAPLVTPAAYVRASMSLPFIFYAFVPGDEHVYSGGAQFSNTVYMPARFVDGGMLSNFPIREFHVAPPAIPKFPTFGVLLSVPAKPQTKEERINKFGHVSVFKFILSFVSTFRRFYDDEFLRNNEDAKQLVQPVDTSEFNSMDFGMRPDKKIDLFKEGAKAAIKQLKDFNWWNYLPTRIKTDKPVDELVKDAATKS